MKTVIHFQNVRKSIRDGASVTIRDIRIREHESVAFYGLSPEVVELLVQQMTGAAGFGQGRISILGTDVRSVNDQSWFSFMEQIGIYNSRSIFKESASIGENLAAVFRLKSDTSKEPQLSQSVWALAKLLQLTITDLSRNMAEASAPLRMRARLGRTLAFRPRVLLLCNPTGGQTKAVSRALTELVRRTRRKLRFTLVFFTDDLRLMKRLADRVLFLNPQNGDFVENRLRGWYHKLFPFLSPSPSQLNQLSKDILQYNGMMRKQQEIMGRE